MSRPGDDTILEVLEDSGIILTPAVISKNTGLSNEYVNERLKPLREHHLVHRVDRGYYEITEKGAAYLAGDLSADDLED